MEPEVLRAIPRDVKLKQAAIYLVIAALVVVVGKQFFMPWLHAYLSVSDRAIALAHFKHVMLGLGASMILAAVYFAVLSARIFIARQWPLPRATVWHDTTVLRGSGATSRALVFALLALVLLGLSVYAAYIPYSR